MKFDVPAGRNPTDGGRVLGKAVDRVDGPLKVTGRATYAYEWHDVLPDQLYGYVVGSAIAKGRIAAMHLDMARQASGVVDVITFREAGPLGKGRESAAPLLGGPDIAHYHQAVALVVAETWEEARAAATLIRIEYVRSAGAYDLDAAVPSARRPAELMVGSSDTSLGDFETGFAAAPIKLDQEYRTPDQAHAMMEPHATLASWEGEKLTLWTSCQIVDWATTSLAAILRVPKANIRVISPFVGGGFGGKLFVRCDTALAAIAARRVGRPVKVTLQRPLMFNNTQHRAATIQKLRLGTSAEGRLLATSHESWSGSQDGGLPEAAGRASRPAYGAPDRVTRTRLAVLDLAEHCAMRAPGDATGSMALEVAMDELAHRIQIDPVRLRVINDSQVDPEHPERPFSQRQLVRCLEEGAKRFGWHRRPRGRSSRLRDGRLVGYGVAAAIRGSRLVDSAARVRLEAGGRIVVETDMTDIGTGSYTVIAQTAAEMMGVPLSLVDVRLGDSNFPVSAGSGGQWGANSSTSGVYAACVKLRAAVAARCGIDVTNATFEGGSVQAGGRAVALTEIARSGPVVGEDILQGGVLDKRFALAAFGAHFIEVSVDPDTAEIRVARMLAVCAAGRILNPKTARSQVIGAMTMGLGAALSEEMAVDKRFGFFVNHDLAGYEVPVHADVPRQEVVFLEENDPVSSPVKARGIGELGICGVAAAIANAVHDATGIRVRSYPLTVDKLLPHMHQLAV